MRILFYFIFLLNPFRMIARTAVEGVSEACYRKYNDQQSAVAAFNDALRGSSLEVIPKYGKKEKKPHLNRYYK